VNFWSAAALNALTRIGSPRHDYKACGGILVNASVKTPIKRRLAKTFAGGFVMGLAAPSLLVSGRLMDIGKSRTSGLGNAWNDVGQFIRESADTQRATRPGGRDKRRA
jgi:hypothetical protein